VTVSRTDILTALHRSLEAEPRALALWEGGSTAFGRADDLSDLDLHVLCEDDDVESILEVVHDALVRLSPLAVERRLPEPTWHGHAQVFYLLRDASPYWMVDLVVLRRSAPERFLEPERHGDHVVLFDRTGEIGPVPLDRPAHEQRMRERLVQITADAPIFRSLVRKEIERGDPLAALSFYQALTLRPLLEVVRMEHCPDRFDYGAKYSQFDLPSGVVARLERLWFVGSVDDLPERQDEAEAWFDGTVAALRSG
jgi:hypothetical protein